jgi:hypothetical protein
VQSTALLSKRLVPAPGGVSKDPGVLWVKINRPIEIPGAVSRLWGFILQLGAGGKPPAQKEYIFDSRYN